MRDTIVGRILATVGATVEGCGPVLWSVDIAKRNGSTITAVPLLHTGYWKQSLPAIMSAGYAARLLDTRPWDESSTMVQELRRRSQALCLEAGILLHFQHINNQDCPMAAVISHTPFHDLLVLGLAGTYDQIVISDTCDALRQVTRNGACPVLLVPQSLREIRHVPIACSGSVASARALKQFVQLRIWPDSALEVCLEDDANQAGTVLGAAGDYLRAHDVTAQLRPMLGHDARARKR